MTSPPTTPVPVGLAAITPAGIRVAGALADRWMPFLLPTAALNNGRELLAEAARLADREHAPTVTAYVPVAVASEESRAGRQAALWLRTYCTQMGPVYPRVLREWGYAVEIDRLLAANVDPKTPVLPAKAERLARDVLLYGTFSDVTRVLAEWQPHADSVALTLPFGLPADELMDVLQALAPAPPPTECGPA